jgi:hypothetical protein
MDALHFGCFGTVESELLCNCVNLVV